MIGLNEADFVGGGVSRKSLTSDGVSRLITFLMSFGFSRPALVGDRHQWSENAARREPKIRWPNLAEPTGLETGCSRWRGRRVNVAKEAALREHREYEKGRHCGDIGISA